MVMEEMQVESKEDPVFKLKGVLNTSMISKAAESGDRGNKTRPISTNISLQKMIPSREHNR